MSAEWVTAEWVTAITAIVTVAYAAQQYRAYGNRVQEEKESKIIENTITLLSEFERDPVIYDVHMKLNKILRENGGDLSKIEDTGELRFYASRILNHYEGIAHRVYAGTVDRKTVEEQYTHLIIRDVDVLVHNKEAGGIKPPGKAIFTPQDAEEWIPNLINLYGELKQKQQSGNAASTT